MEGAFLGPGPVPPGIGGQRCRIRLSHRVFPGCDTVPGKPLPSPAARGAAPALPTYAFSASRLSRPGGPGSAAGGAQLPDGVLREGKDGGGPAKSVAFPAPSPSSPAVPSSGLCPQGRVSWPPEDSAGVLLRIHERMAASGPTDRLSTSPDGTGYSGQIWRLHGRWGLFPSRPLAFSPGDWLARTPLSPFIDNAPEVPVLLGPAGVRSLPVGGVRAAVREYLSLRASYDGSWLAFRPSASFTGGFCNSHPLGPLAGANRDRPVSGTRRDSSVSLLWLLWPWEGPFAFAGATVWCLATAGGLRTHYTRGTWRGSVSRPRPLLGSRLMGGVHLRYSPLAPTVRSGH